MASAANPHRSTERGQPCPRLLVLFLAVSLATQAVSPAATPVGSTFTYQGRLNDGTAPANGLYDFRFAVFDDVAAGNQIGPTITNGAVLVSNGVFTTQLDFGGGTFSTNARWLELGVRKSPGTFTLLNPRQPITATPYALAALNAASVAASNLTGLVSDTQLSTNVALQNTGASFTGPVRASSFIGDGSGLTSVGTAAMVNRLLTTNDIYIFDGDSRTATTGWPEYAITNLFFAGRASLWTNLSVSGSSIGSGTNRYATIVHALRPTNGQNAYLFDAFGINDLLIFDAVSAFSIKSNYWRTARSDGFKVIALTIPPANDGYSFAVNYPRRLYSAFDDNRRRLNQMIRQSGLCDGVIDADAVINEPANTSVYQGDAVHFQPATAVSLGALASQYMLTLGRRNLAEDFSPNYPRWRTTLPLKNAPRVVGNDPAQTLPGNDGGGVFGFYDVLTFTPGTNRSFVEHIPFRMGWTNLSVLLWLTTESSNTSYFYATMTATLLNTNTLAGLEGPGAACSTSTRLVINSYPQVQQIPFNLSWTNDIAPRQLWTQFYGLDGTNLTDKVYVLDLEASGY
jgi:hypothetical protein